MVDTFCCVCLYINVEMMVGGWTRKKEVWSIGSAVKFSDDTKRMME